MIAATMVPVMAEQAMADIKFPADSKWDNHQYEIYQIYIGDVDSDNPQGLLNIKYGANHASGTAGDAVDQSEVEALVDIVANARGTNDLADLLATGGYVDLTGTPYKTLTKDTTGKKVNVETGYYLIKDKDNTVTGNDTYTLYIMEVLQGEFQITPKADVPSDEKKVADINDSTQTTADAYSDSADYDIGDDVPFQLKATTAANTSSYYKYHITFNDKQSIGLDTPTSFTVSVLGKTFTVTAAGEVTPASATTDNGTIITVTKPTVTGTTFAIKVEFESTAHANKGTNDALTAAMALNAEVNSTDILVNYTARLNEDAVIGGAGNKNESHIDYSNNPNDEDGGDEGHTPDKPAIVFTYKFMMDKVDQDYEGLTGAGFVLLKELASGTASVTATKQADLDVAEGTIVSYNSKIYKVVKNWGIQASSYNFNYKGIDDGNYLIVETHVPTGYNQAADVPFTVEAEHTKDGITTLTVTGIQGNKDGGTFEFHGDDASKKDTIDAGDEAAAATAIINQSGTTLPSTGGMGTTILYIGGSILVLAAAILLITKRCMSADE